MTWMRIAGVLLLATVAHAQPVQDQTWMVGDDVLCGSYERKDAAARDLALQIGVLIPRSWEGVFCVALHQPRVGGVFTDRQGFVRCRLAGTYAVDWASEKTITRICYELTVTCDGQGQGATVCDG